MTTSILRRRRLFWRVYLHGLLMLFVVSSLVGVMAWTAGGQPFWRQVERGTLTTLKAAIDQADLQRRLDMLGEFSGVNAAIYTEAGDLLAQTGALTPAPISPEAMEEMRLEGRENGHRGDQMYMDLRLEQGPALPSGAYITVSWPDHKNPLRFIGALALTLLTLALLSIPLARHIARPLEQLIATTRALGAGDLSARTGLNRRDEVGTLARALDDMAARLHHMISNGREMLANISHELRTPLTRLRVALELSQSDPAFLADVEQDLIELEQLVSDVLLNAQLGQEQLPLNLDALDAEAVARAAAERLLTHHPEADLEVELAPRLPAPQADAALIRRLIDNLLENAIKHGAAPIILKMAPAAGGGLSISVRDHGPGVQPDALAHIFEPFFRTDLSRNRQTGGVGLGLALCKRIAEAHGGALTAQRAAEGGLQIDLRLP